MPNETIKQQIQFALARFGSGRLADNARDLFGVLGYRSDKTVRLASSSPQAFVGAFDVDTKFNAANALFDQWASADLLFQLTTDEVAHAEQRALFEAHGATDRNIAQSYLFLAVGLHGEAYSRTHLAAITRAVNKIFKQPALILFKHGVTLTLAVIDHRPDKREQEKDVLEKVTLIKDIRLASPHRAHIEILADLALDQLRARFDITNWVQLHDAWRKTLDTSELNKRFFREIANWYFWAQSKVKFPKGAGKNDAERNAISVIRLLTRLIFVWFVKEKNLIPDELFDEKDLRGFVNLEGLDKSTYYKAILQNLFFGTLNTEMGTRAFRHQPKTGQRADDYMAHNRYRYEKLFKKPDEFLKLCAPVPFLNGGLFECLDKSEDERVDGFSDRPDNELVVPDELFFGKEREIDLNETFGTTNKRYKVRGLIHTFEHYKFTVDENTPIEEEIALDPELLGKVFENLLAAYDENTGVTARKQTGSFYTPREIVNYMVDESLIACLNPKGLGDPSGLRNLLAYNDEPHGFSDDEIARLIAAIDALKALDPASGSGAFPMGLLHKLVYVLRKLDPDNSQWKALQIARANAIEDAKERESELADIEDAFANEADYARKLYVIQNCLYGVDIQPIAVQIAKLRCFISLIVDDKVDETKPNRGIRPLPNLETKFVAAHSLIGIDRPPQEDKPKQTESVPPGLAKKYDELITVFQQYRKVSPTAQKKYLAEGEALAEEINRALQDRLGFEPLNANWIFTTARSVDDLIDKLPGAKRAEQANQTAFRTTEIEEKEKELAAVRRRHFRARTRKTKEECRKQDEKLRAEIAALLKKDGWGDDTAKKLAAWNPYDQNTAAEFFDAEWMFDVREGFDIVIGNPPYVSYGLRNAQTMSSEEKERFHVAFPDSAEYKISLYALFIDMSIRLSKQENGVQSLIVPDSFLLGMYFSKVRKLILKQTRIREILWIPNGVFESVVGYSVIYFFQRALSSKGNSVIVKSAVSSEQVANRSFQSFTYPQAYFERTALNRFRLFFNAWDKAFVEKIEDRGEVALSELAKITTGVRSKVGKDSVVAKTKKGPKWKRGITSSGQVLPYAVAWDGDWLNIDGNILFAGGWDAEYVEKPKVMIRQTGDSIIAGIDLENLYHLNNVHTCAPLEGKGNVYFIAALLNSKLMNKYYHLVSLEEGRPLAQTDIETLEKLPIPQTNSQQQKPIIALVDRILAAKRKDLDADTSEPALSEVEGWEREIDARVYQLYGLTEEEIKVVEGKG